MVKIVPKAAHGAYASGPLMDPPPGRRVTFRNPKAETSPKRDVGTTPWNPPSWMWKHG